MELCQQDAPWNDEVKEAAVKKCNQMSMLLGVFTENELSEKYYDMQILTERQGVACGLL